MNEITTYLRSLPEMADVSDADLRRFALAFAAFMATRGS
jgi:hypothetical protein